MLSLILTASILGISQGYAVDWRRLEEVAERRYGPSGRSSINNWQTLLNESSGLPVNERLIRVNDFFNERVRWTSDAELFGQSDYWATPLETMALAAGDCEDFSIAKFVTLTSLGIPSSELRLVYVKARRPGLAPQAHMVLAWYESPNAVPLILDNLNTRLLPATERNDLVPIFSFNDADLWLGTGPQRSGRDPRARMARWQQVLAKMQAEGMAIDN